MKHNPRIVILVTGGTFDKEYNEITGKLFFNDSHIREMLDLGRCNLKVDIKKIMLKDSLDMKKIDRKLIFGSSLFGIGWGMIGLCPGPAISSIAFLQPLSILFIFSMMAGFYISIFFKL